MAGGMDLGGSGKAGKKPLDTPINLVPFIDLMAVTISFLIMTAVWNQISRLTVAQKGGPGPDAPVGQVHSVPITVIVGASGFVVQAGGATTQIEKVDEHYVYCHRDSSKIDDKCDERSLAGELRRLKALVPQQLDITVQCEDAVPYDDLVRVIDLCNSTDPDHGVLFPDVSVSGIG